MSLVRGGETHEAAFAAGYAAALGDIANDIEQKRPSPQESATDSTWVDPASRRSRRGEVA